MKKNILNFSKGKKIFVFFLFAFLLFSCTEEKVENSKNTKKENEQICIKPYKIGSQISKNIRLK